MDTPSKAIEFPRGPARWGLGALALAALLLTACATSGAKDRDAASLARFEAASGEPVPSFRFFSLQGYTVLGENRLAVWTRPREAWLLTVDEPCFDLRWTQGIGVTSSLGRVHARFDRVVIGQQRCRITEVRPVDVDALRESERKARGEQVEVHARDAAPATDAPAQSDGGT